MIAVVWSTLSRWGAALRAIAGAPSYERYLAHMHAVHPGDRVMSEAEFSAARLSDRYDRAGSRCC